MTLLQLLIGLALLVLGVYLYGLRLPERWKLGHIPGMTVAAEAAMT